MKVVVIGGHGFYGQKVVAALSSLQNIKTYIASRRSKSPHIKLDLCDESSFERIREFDVVINCSDSVAAAAQALMKYCLKTGIDYFEMGATEFSTQNLLNVSVDQPKGRAIIGVGIFPGISTILAHHVCKEQQYNVNSLELGIRLSPLSGAGAGNCNLMTKMLTIPSYSIIDGQVVHDRPVGRAVSFYFHGGNTYTANQIALADTALLNHAMKVPNIATYLAINPSFLRYNFSLLSVIYKYLGPLKNFYLWGVYQILRLTRSVLFQNKSTEVQFSIVVNRGEANEVHQHLTIKDGQMGTAFGVAVALSLWHEKSDLKPGIYGVSQAFDLETFAQCWLDITGSELMVVSDS